MGATGPPLKEMCRNVGTHIVVLFFLASDATSAGVHVVDMRKIKAYKARFFRFAQSLPTFWGLHMPRLSSRRKHVTCHIWFKLRHEKPAEDHGLRWIDGWSTGNPPKMAGTFWFCHFYFFLGKSYKIVSQIWGVKDKKHGHSIEHSCEASGKLFGALEDSHGRPLPIPEA